MRRELDAERPSIRLESMSNGRGFEPPMITLYGVKLTRRYRDGEEWATTDTFGRDDLLLVSKVADLAHTWIFVETQNGLGGPRKSQPERDTEPE